MTRRMTIPRSTRQELLRLIAGFSRRRILVVGDLMLDQYVRGTVGRLSPEAPVPVVHVKSDTVIPGGAGNVANNLAALGANVAIVGLIGPDEPGQRLVDCLRAKEVEIEGIYTDSSRMTTQKCRVIAEHQQVVRFDRESTLPVSAASEGALLDRIERAIQDTEAVIVSDYGKGVIGPRLLAKVISAAKRRNLPITVDPKPEHFSRYVGVTCLTPNTNEAWACMHRRPNADPAALDALGRDILRKLRSHSVLITRGPEGMSLYERGGRTTHIPTMAREVFDVSGAGDTVISTLTLALAGKASLKNAALLANHAAGIVVGKLGTATTTAKELSEVIR